MGFLNPLIPDALGQLNQSHGLANGLQSAFQFNAAGKPVDLVSSKRGVTVSGYGFDGVGANGPSFKASTTGDKIQLTSLPAGSAWTISTLTRFPIDANTFATLARSASQIFVCRNSSTDALCSFIGSAINFSPTIAPLTLSGWKRLTVCGHAGGVRAYLDGVFAGSHSTPVSSDQIILSILGDHTTASRAWGAAKDYFIWNRTLGPAEVADHAIDSWAMFRNEDWFALIVPAAGGGVTGTIASTEAADVLAATGSVQTVGTIAATEAADVLAASGFLGFTGTIATTEAKDVLAATGKVYITGTAPLAESADVLAATGTVSQPARTGTIVLVEASDTFAASGSSGATDCGGIISRASIKRLKRKAEEDRKRRESTWEAGLLASKELVEQVARAMDGPQTIATQRAVAKFIDDEEEEIEMLLMAA